MKELNKLIKVCKEFNYDFHIQFYDNEFNVSVQDNNVSIDKDIADVGGYDELKDALTQVLKMID